MKLLCFSDPHLDYPADPTDVSVALFENTAKWLADLVREHKPDAVINCGDTNHRDGGMSTGTIDLAYRFFDPLFKACTELKIELINIVGNHDQHTRDGSLHVMNLLKWNSKVVDAPYSATIAGREVLFMPYNRDVDAFVTQFNELAAIFRPEIAFMHMDVVGSKMNSGSKASHGLNDLNVSFPVFNGHYHMPQTVGGIEVVGAPQYTQFRDIDPADVPRRGALLLTRSKSKKNTWKQERFTNPHTKHFVKIKGETYEDMSGQYSAWLQDRTAVYGQIDKSLINVWFVGPKVELAKLEPSMEWSELGVARFTPNDRVAVEQTNLTLDLNTETAVRKYFDEAECSCGQQHDLNVGLAAIKQAEDYAATGAGKRRIDFKSMELQNFMQFKEAQVSLDRQGLVLIEGVNQDDSSVDSNESGKSTIVEALLWCLFDRTSRGIGKDDVIRWGEKRAEVAVTLALDGQQFKFVRSRSKGKQVLNILDADGKDVTPHDQNAATAQVQSILGVTFEQFLLLVTATQGFDTKFSSLNDADRKETLEAFLGLEVYDAARRLLSEELKRRDTEAMRFEEAIVRATSAKSTAERQRMLAEEEKQRVQQEKHAERADLELRICEFDEIMPRWREGMRAREEAVSRLNQTCSSLSNQIADRQRKHDTALRTWQTENTTLERLSAQRLAYQTDGASCQTCLQRLTPEQITRLIEDVSRKMEGSTELMSRCIADMGQLKVEVEGLNKSLSEQTPNLDAARADFESFRQQFANVQAEGNALRREHEKTLNTVDRFDRLITDAQSVIDAATIDIARAEDGKVQYASIRHQLKFWLDAFEPTGIRSHLLRTVVNYLNEYLYDLSQSITGGTFTVQLSSTKELKSKETRNKLDVVITPSGESYKAGSGGKRRKIDLMLNLAVAKLARQTAGFSTNLFVGDEVLDNLDFTASQHAVRMFEKMAEEGVTVLLISHNHLVKSMIPNSWTVVRRGGVSELRAA